VGNGAHHSAEYTQNTIGASDTPLYDLCLRPLPRTSQLSFHRPSAYLKMAPRERRKKRKQSDRSPDERSGRQPNPSRNEQESPQGGGRSSVTVSIAFLIPSRPGWWLTVIITLQRDNINMEAGASLPLFSAGHSIGHTANSRNPTARDNMSNSRNTSSRNYNDANHNEFNRSTINGPVTINSQSRVRTRKAMKNLGR